MLKITPDYVSANKKLSLDQINDLEMHSFINLMNVIYSQLELLLMDDEGNLYLKEALAQTRGLLDEIRSGKLDGFLPKHVLEYKNTVRRTLHSIEKKAGDAETMEEIREARSLLEYIFSILDVRLEELYKRIPDPDEWLRICLDDFRKEHDTYFDTLEKNSKGRFRIVRDAAHKREDDYLVEMDITSGNGSTIAMPLLFKDVIRDLISNARKYTPPGGTIRIGIQQQQEHLRCIVSDTGIGIPKEELPLVFEYGYRASNTGDIRTMGGGFGLTKALHVVRHFKGDLWIDSEPDKGTTITIELPLPRSIRIQKNEKKI